MNETAPHLLNQLPAAPRWARSLVVKCLAGILSIFYLSAFLLLLTLALLDRSRLHQEVAPENLEANLAAGVIPALKNIQWDGLDPQVSSAVMESLIPKALGERGVLRRRYNRSRMFDRRMSLLISYRDGEGRVHRFADSRQPALEEAVNQAEQKAELNNPARIWRRDPQAGWLSVAALALPGDSGGRAVIGLRLDNRFFSLLFPDLRALGHTVIFLSFISLLSALLVAALLLGRIRRAEKAAEAWGRGDLSVRINDRRGDEFGRLTQAFDHMADVLAKMFEAKQALAVAEERNRLARDLHDTAKQRCFALGLQLNVLAHGCAGDPKQAELARTALELTGLLQKDLTEVIQGFTWPTIAQEGLQRAFEDTLGRILRGSDLRLRLELQPKAVKALEAEPQLATQMFLITLEGTANALRHSLARELKISFTLEGGRAVWMISDDGRGFQAGRPESRGLGLSSVRRRVHNLPSGRLLIDSEPGQGVTLTITFDLGGS